LKHLFSKENNHWKTYYAGETEPAVTVIKLYCNAIICSYCLLFQ